MRPHSAAVLSGCPDIRAAGRHVLTLLPAIALLLIAATGPASAAPAGCGEGVSRQTTERLFALLNHPPAEAECRFAGVATERSTLTARWTSRGEPLPALRVMPRACAPDAAGEAPFVLEVPPEIAASCPSVAPQLAAVAAQLAGEAPVGRRGSLDDPLYRWARWWFAGLALVLAALLARGAAGWRRLDPSWTLLGLAGVSAAVAVRGALPFTLGNWYAEVLPAAGAPPPMRFGPGLYAMQSLLRDVGLWNSGMLAVSQVAIGAAAVPLLLGVMRELRLGIDAAAASALLLALAPFHARLSATSSEHVLASTLCMALLYCWLRARRGDMRSLLAALLLFPAVCATRADASVQALLALTWPLLSDRAERAADLQPPRPWQLAAMAAIAAATVAATFVLIVVPSQHPRPDWAGHLFALRWSLPQFWLLATTEPHWLSLPAVLLAAVGAPAMAVRRPLLLLRVAATVLLSFIVAGRTFMHDELLGARYFLFTIPIFLILSGFGFATIAGFAPLRLRRGAVAAGIALLALWAAVAGRSAYAARYAFQDEYSFARDVLGQLPAGCTVYQLPVRHDALPRDLDCCLDVPRSPLVLDFPQLRFAALADDALPRADGCAAYFEGVACAIVPGPAEAEGHALAARAAAHFSERCAGVRRQGRLTLLAETTTSPRSTEDLFFGIPPAVRLYRWQP